MALALLLIPILPAQRTDPLAGLPANPLHRQRQQNKLAQHIVELHAVAFVETHLSFAAIDLFLVAIPVGYRPVVQREIGIDGKPGCFQAPVAIRFHLNGQMARNPNLSIRPHHQLRLAFRVERPGLMQIRIFVLCPQLEIDLARRDLDIETHRADIQVPKMKEHSELLPQDTHSGIPGRTEQSISITKVPGGLSPSVTLKHMVVEIEGVPLHLAHPDELSITWVGQEEVMRQLLAAWLVIDAQDLPMNPRLLGKPGVGKTTLAYAAAKRLDREVYIMQATVDTRPEDLLVTPVIEGEARLRYVASPLVTAMLRGGVVILDEGNRMSEKSWASLAPLLDNRRYVESIVAGIKIKAHPLFRVVATMNDDASTFDLPEYIHSRLQPMILIDFPERHEEFAILRENLPFADDHILNYVTDFLQQAHAADERYTARDGINIARFSMKLMHSEGTINSSESLKTAIVQTLGEEALRYVARS